MRPDGGTKRQQAPATNASTESNVGTSRKREKSEPTVKDEVAEEERTLRDFDTVYDYLENTKPKYEFEDFATLKEQYIPLLVRPGDDYTRQHGVKQEALPRTLRGLIAKLPKDGGIFLDDIPLHHRTDHALHPLEEQRLKLCGLAIKKFKKWTREEDEALVENWREYAAHHDVPLRDASKFFGSAKEESLELRQFAQATLFHPWMCKRLLHRTCRQTKCRGKMIFHRNYRLRDGKPMWTADDDELLLRLVKAHNGNFKEVALQMGRIRYDCIAHYYWLRKHGGVDDGTVLPAKKRRAGAGIEWPDEDAQRLQHMLDRFGSQWVVVGLWMDRSPGSCRKHAVDYELKFDSRRSRQMVGVERYLIEPWSADQLQNLLDFLREALPCNPVKFLRSEEHVGFEHGIDWYTASEHTAKSATECRTKWCEFKEYILEQVSNGCRKKDILQGLLQLTGAFKRARVRRRNWTPAEIQQLVCMVGDMGRCWVKIGRELNREPSTCMAKYYVYKGHITDHAAEWTLEELQRFYDHLYDKLYWHPVEAARRRGGDRDILWKDVANVTGKSARDCQNMWKRLKAQFPVSQQHLQTHDVYKIAEHALQSCLVKVKQELVERDEVEALEGVEPLAEAVYEEAEGGENDAPAPPVVDVTPSQLSRCITILLEQDVLESKKDFDAVWLQINFHKTPPIACASEDIVRYVRRMLRRCKRAGMWARLPQEQRTLRGKLKALEFVLSRSEELLVPPLRFRKLLKKFAKQGEFKLLPRDDDTEEPAFWKCRLDRVRPTRCVATDGSGLFDAHGLRLNGPRKNCENFTPGLLLSMGRIDCGVSDYLAKTLHWDPANLSLVTFTWKRLKAQFLASKRLLQSHDVDKVAEHALQRCVVDVEQKAVGDKCESADDGTKLRAEPVVAGKKSPRKTTIVQSRPAYTLRRCLPTSLRSSCPSVSNSFSSKMCLTARRISTSNVCVATFGSCAALRYVHVDDLIRHVCLMLKRCSKGRMFARLPPGQRTLRGKLEALIFVLSLSDHLLVPARRLRKQLKAFAKQKGFELLGRVVSSEQPGTVDLRFPCG